MSTFDVFDVLKFFFRNICRLCILLFWTGLFLYIILPGYERRERFIYVTVCGLALFAGCITVVLVGIIFVFSIACCFGAQFPNLLRAFYHAVIADFWLHSINTLEKQRTRVRREPLATKLVQHIDYAYSRRILHSALYHVELVIALAPMRRP